MREPNNYAEANKDERWIASMYNELQVLEDIKTWFYTGLLEGKKAVSSKWVYRFKYKPNGEVNRFKARLVVKGYHQTQAVDYTESFSPVAKNVTVRVMLALALAAKQWPLHQVDVNNAYLHRHLDEELGTPSGL